MKTPKPKKKVPGNLRRIEFFELPKLLTLIRNIEEHKDEYAIIDDEAVHPGHYMQWSIHDLDKQLWESLDYTKLDCYYSVKRIPRLLAALIDPDFHIDIYNQLLEFFPDDLLLLKYKAACIVSIPTS